MTAELWDAHGASPLFEIFARLAESAEQKIMLASPLKLPPFDDFDQMAVHVPEFNSAWYYAEEAEVRLTALRTLYLAEIRFQFSDEFFEQMEAEGVEIEPLGYEYVSAPSEPDAENPSDIREVSLHDVISELVNFSAAQIDVLLDDAEWERWKEWGVALLAIDRYLDVSRSWRKWGMAPWENYSSLVWLYLLKGRLCRTDKSIPPAFRRYLFDWLELPVSFSDVPALRYLVPVEALSGSLADDDAAYKERIQRAYWKRPSR